MVSFLRLHQPIVELSFEEFHQAPATVARISNKRELPSSGMQLDESIRLLGEW